MKQQRYGPTPPSKDRRHVPRSLLRRVAGWCLIVLAVLGVALPVLPGLPFLALGILVLGPHDPTLRRIAVALRLLLRRWSQARHRHVRRTGSWARQQYRDARHALRAHLHRHRHGADGWRSHLALLGVMLISVTISAGIIFAVWRSVP